MTRFAKTLLASALMAGAAAAQAEISANVALTSDYKFRGVSQTDAQMALQGGFDFSHESGFYAGTWASNVDSRFFSGDGQADPQLEVDLYAGFSGESDGIGYDVGVLRYVYPGYDDSDTTELYVGGSYGPVSATLYYSNELNFIGVDESAWYLNVGAEMEVAEGVSLSASVGYSWGDAWETLGKASGTSEDAYFDYSIGVSGSAAGVDLSLAFVGADDNGKDIFGGNPAEKLTEGKLILTVSKSM